MKTIADERREVRSALWQTLNATHAGLVSTQVGSRNDMRSNFTERQVKLIEDLLGTVEELQGDMDRASPSNEGDEKTPAGSKRLYVVAHTAGSVFNEPVVKDPLTGEGK
jgi:hypothetical protein